MSSRSRAWMVAGTVGLVEALKDQGFARWNYTIGVLFLISITAAASSDSNYHETEKLKEANISKN
ncbi:hypothetical protein Ccrd_018368 [Cynara cardunculus var. scolymus]|uniref:Uncharacterized protein n=1 Tax=Cynara cardunculus var. scolymus TaxID=59895 RepID=A0A103Y6C5_CYNCS|nr:hypothetical protein Ccrd_018368 [Cynara cardunculus var. scolymus]